MIRVPEIDFPVVPLPSPMVTSVFVSDTISVVPCEVPTGVAVQVNTALGNAIGQFVESVPAGAIAPPDIHWIMSPLGSF
jgi:hypothetical protein